MFLTRFRINTARRGSRTLLASPQKMHAAVRAGFTDLDTSRPGRLLWRVDAIDRADTRLYIVSPGKPDLTHLVEQAGWPTTEAWDTRDYGALLDRLEAGQTWAFRLTANPVRDGRRADGGDTKRYGHVTVTQQQQWLLDRAERAGFRVPVASTKEPDVVVHSRATRTFPRQGRTVTLSIATFDGRLEVLEPDNLRRTLISGLGKAKAYGCGLLTLAPIG